jgi:predicted unusual protein kinase regulating ubiquinone biosynthesis (AarF/ABC1/UbiB family)
MNDLFNGIELDRYDAGLIQKYFDQYPLRVRLRFLEVFLPLSTLIFKLRYYSQTSKKDKASSQAYLRTLAKETRELITRLGPAFIKIGQALSTRPDIVPPVFMDEFALLQDQLPPFSNEIAFRFIREALGAEPLEIYSEISEVPIAAASLGQVYKARLHNGDPVAVKVQRPDIAEGIALDMYILRGIAGWMMRHIKFVRSDLIGILEEFASRIFEEMDYNHEADNAEKFASYYGHLEGIYVPRIYREYTAKRVLTMEWIEGIKLTNVEKVKDAGFDSREIIGVGVQCSLKQLLDHGFFHADPHPGNLLVMEDGKLAYLDFGMMSEVNAPQRFGLIEAIVHLVNRDFEALSKDYVRLGFLTPDVDSVGITEALSSVFNPPPGTSLVQMDFKDMTDQLSQIMYDYPFRVPPYYALIIRSLVTLEGIAFTVDRNFKVLAVAYPYVANRLLMDETPELRHALKDVLFRNGEFRWNRLENLLTNARTNVDYDVAATVDKVVDFLLSERGEFLRQSLIDELAKTLETEAAKQLQQLRNFSFRRKEPQSESALNKDPEMPSNWEQISQVIGLLRQDSSINPQDLLKFARQTLAKPATLQVGREVVTQVAQRLLARGIREFALQGSSNSEVIYDSAVQSAASSKAKLRRQVNGRSW